MTRSEKVFALAWERWIFATASAARVSKRASPIGDCAATL